MNKIVKVTGFCPAQNKEYSIDVTYLDASTNDGKEYAKGTFKCKHNTMSDKCDSNKCPIYCSVK